MSALSDVTCIGVANPGYGGRTRAATPSSAAGRSGRAGCREERSTSLTPTGFSRGQAICVALTSTRIRHANTSAVRWALSTAAGRPPGGRVRPCRARRVSWKSAERFIRASSVIAFSLRLVSAGVLSRGADVVTNQQLDARESRAYERRSISRHVEPRPPGGLPAAVKDARVRCRRRSSATCLA